MTFNEWAARWQIPAQALVELRDSLGAGAMPPSSGTAPGLSEQTAQQRVRLDASKAGARLWRNNNGAMVDDSGRVVRYGLANDSKALSKKIKSSDLIGITPYTVRPEDVGAVLGVFTSIEMKRPGWHYTATEREEAQLAWLKLVASLGGIAYFST